MRRIAGFFLCIVLVCGMLTPGAVAAGEAEEVPGEELTLEEPAQGELSAEDTSGEELSTIYVTVDGECIEVDPEDPLYERMMSTVMVLDGAWSDMDSFKKFSPRTAEGETVVPGIDVSSWQPTIDWEAVAASGVEFVFLRCAFRGTSTGKLVEDNCFHKHIAGAKAAGLQVGVYIYSQAITVAEGIEEAQYMMDMVKDYHIDLPLVLDYEYLGNSGRLYNANLSRRAATDICLAFCDAVEAAGYDSMVYANASMLNNDLFRDELERVWLAHYTTKTSYSGDYEYWQCSQSGTVDGIGGYVDLNFWFRAEEEELPTATPVPSPEVQVPFTDVTEGMWYYDTVMAAHARGIVNGMSDTEFCPDETASRGQVVTMLWRLMGQPEPECEAAFEDLTETYYQSAVSWAAGAGVVKGCSETEFCPDEEICRQDLVTILYRLAGSPAVDQGVGIYEDGDAVRDYAAAAMSWAVSKGVINGYEDNTLRPDNSASRAEVCAILMRYIDL